MLRLFVVGNRLETNAGQGSFCGLLSKKMHICRGIAQRLSSKKCLSNVTNLKSKRLKDKMMKAMEWKRNVLRILFMLFILACYGFLFFMPSII